MKAIKITLAILGFLISIYLIGLFADKNFESKDIGNIVALILGAPMGIILFYTISIILSKK